MSAPEAFQVSVPSPLSVKVSEPFTFTISLSSVVSDISLDASAFLSHSLTMTSFTAPLASVLTYTVSTLPASDSLEATAEFVTILSSISDSACVSTAAVSSVTVLAPHATDIIASIAAIITENDFIKLFLIMTNFSFLFLF